MLLTFEPESQKVKSRRSKVNGATFGLSSFPGLWIKGIAQAVAEEVERKQSQSHCHARKNQLPGINC